MNNAASAKVQKYREDYSASDVNKAFLPALLSTSGRIHGEFLRLLYIFAPSDSQVLRNPRGGGIQ